MKINEAAIVDMHYQGDMRRAMLEMTDEEDDSMMQFVQELERLARTVPYKTRQTYLFAGICIAQVMSDRATLLENQKGVAP